MLYMLLNAISNKFVIGRRNLRRFNIQDNFLGSNHRYFVYNMPVTYSVRGIEPRLSNGLSRLIKVINRRSNRKNSTAALTFIRGTICTFS